MRLFEELALVFALLLLMLGLFLICMGCLGTFLQGSSNSQVIEDAQWERVTPSDPSLRCWQRIVRTTTVICDRAPTEETASTPAILPLQEKEVSVEK